MKKFETPVIEIEKIEAVDVIATSGEDLSPVAYCEADRMI